MASDVQIASLALTRIGHEGIASFSATGNKASRWFFANYDLIVRPMIREHQWRFATKRAVLTRDRIATITGATNGAPIVLTAPDHGFANDDFVYIDGILGMTEVNGASFIVTGATTNTLQLAGSNGTSYGVYAGGGSITRYITKEYAYRYALPEDCLRLIRINAGETDEYRVEQGCICTNQGAVHIEYIFNQEDEAQFDAQFVDLLAARLSAEICFYMTSNSTLTEQQWTIYNGKLSMARTMDSRQGTPRGIEADAWLNARA